MQRAKQNMTSGNRFGRSAFSELTSARIVHVSEALEPASGGCRVMQGLSY